MVTNSLMQTLLEANLKFYPATNSLKGHSSDNQCYLWVEPPWRLVKDKRLIASSFTCPWHEDFKSKMEYDDAFGKWANSFSYLNTILIKSYNLNAYNDLVIEWTDGSVMEVIQKDQENESWYFSDKRENKIYLAYPDRLSIQPLGKPA